MTGKRFTSMYNEQSDMIQYVDTLKEEPNKWSICNVSETLKMLNELHEEIEYLKPLANENTQYIDDMEDDIITFQQKIKKLEKENKQLRTALKELKEIGDYQADRIQELNDENEQLTRKIQRERKSTQQQHQKWSTQAEEQIQALQKQLESEHQMLENAILLERTRMGQNALKQFRDAIQ